MAQLFEKRMEMSEQVAAFKKARGLSIRDAERERELIDRNRRHITDPAVASYYVQFLRGVLDLSCAYQSRLLNGMKVAYSGVEGAYGYLAARRMFPEARLIAYPDFAAAHRAVEVGEADSAVLPLENSYAGEVGAVMDLLFSGELYINQVLDMEIDHSLLGVENATVDTVRAVVSICDCMNYLLEEEDLLKTFQLVNNYLDPDGIFIFDFNTIYKYKEVMGDTVIAENREDCSFIWENYYDVEEEINEYDLTIFVQTQEDLFQRFTETHLQRGYTLAQMQKILQKAGLVFLKAIDVDTQGDVTEQTERICIIAREHGKRKEA